MKKIFFIYIYTYRICIEKKFCVSDALEAAAIGNAPMPSLKTQHSRRHHTKRD